MGNVLIISCGRYHESTYISIHVPLREHTNRNFVMMSVDDPFALFYLFLHLPASGQPRSSWYFWYEDRPSEWQPRNGQPRSSSSWYFWHKDYQPRLWLRRPSEWLLLLGIYLQYPGRISSRSYPVVPALGLVRWNHAFCFMAPAMADETMPRTSWFLKPKSFSMSGHPILSWTCFEKQKKWYFVCCVSMYRTRGRLVRLLFSNTYRH